jgi:hypothetical protein
LGFTINAAFGKDGGLLKKPSDADSILIHSNLTNLQSHIIIDAIDLYGNNVTKSRIILRELNFRTSDTIPSYQLADKLQRSSENLLKTSLFNFVTFEDSVITAGDFSRIKIKISVIERWYFWPFPIFEISDRNFNAWWKEKNFGKVNYGLYLIKENMRGRMERLNILLRFGYDERYEVSYEIPYINQNQTFGAGLGSGWQQNHEIAYKTVDNQLETIRFENDYLFKHFYTFFHITHRPTLYQYHVLQINYNFYSFGDTVLKLNPDYSFNNQKTNEYFTLYYRFTNDYRDSKVYPLKGSVSEFEFTKSGFGLLKNGDISMMDLKGAYRKYFEFSDRFHLSLDLAAKISTNRNQPYFFQKGLGYDRNFVRGYELYVIDGHSYWLSKNTFKYTLVPTQVRTIGFINSEKFNKIHYSLYLNYFFDAGYADTYKNYDVNSLANKLIFGSGFGLDVVTYYDLVFGVEFSINRSGNSGFFIHFKNTL